MIGNRNRDVWINEMKDKPMKFQLYMGKHLGDTKCCIWRLIESYCIFKIISQSKGGNISNMVKGRVNLSSSPFSNILYNRFKTLKTL